jgi:diaminopimelate epimerase
MNDRSGNTGTVIPFVKASACGNDFLIIDGLHAPPDLPEFSRRICERHNGVGADGVEWLFPAQDADVRARLINADGSEAEISGNGTRCVAAYLCWQSSREQVTVRTGAGVKSCTLISREGKSFEFETVMGEPQVGDEFPIRVAFGEARGIPVSMGNPHFVVFVGDFTPGWQGDAAEIGKHHDFKYGINVEFVLVRDEQNIEVRFFERGVGETQSSGTGSCASAVAAIFSKKARSPVCVHAPGGVQTVRWENQVFLRGPAHLTCRGEFLL